MSSSQEDEHIEDWEETSLRELGGEERSPVEESFYESYIIQSRTAVDNLYASNVLSCQKHMKVMKDLARQRRVKISSFEREQKKLVKKIENLKDKQESYQQRKSKMNRCRSKSVNAQEETADNFNKMHRRRDSLPPLITNTEVESSKLVKSSDRLRVPGKIHYKSCNDLSLPRGSASHEPTTVVLPAIKSSRSHDKLSETPFITHISSKVHTYPLTTREHLQHIESRDSKSNWEQKNFNTQISTKVKWVPRN